MNILFNNTYTIMIKKLLILTPFLAGLMFQSCSDDDFSGANLNPVSVNAEVKFAGDFSDTKAINTNVLLKNTETGAEYKGVTDKDGKLVLPTVLPGKYTATVTLTLTPKQFEAYFGYPSGNEEDIVFNGAAENIAITSTNTTLSIELMAAKTVGGLVIKQIYYGGSHIKEGAVFRDQFVEIYNNSNEVMYADGLIFAQLYGTTTTGTESYHTSTGQLDWSKGEGNTKGAAANTDYVYADWVYRIPGSGIQYPIQPGKSITIAATAINHKANYTDNSGNAVNILNPDLTVDLSNADFEANFTSYTGSQYRWDIQNLSVPDLDILFVYAGKEMTLDNLGRDAYVILNATAAEYNGFTKVKSPDPRPTSERYCIQIPNSFILDAVETTTDLANNLIPKKLNTSDDAGRTYLLQGAYTSTSVIRKTAKTINGRIILKDTNNSTEDFVNIKANPKAFAN